MRTSRKIGYGNKIIPNNSHTKLLGATVDHIFSSKNNTLVNKLITACYVL